MTNDTNFTDYSNVMCVALQYIWSKKNEYLICFCTHLPMKATFFLRSLYTLYFVKPSRTSCHNIVLHFATRKHSNNLVSILTTAQHEDGRLEVLGITSWRSPAPFQMHTRDCQCKKEQPRNLPCRVASPDQFSNFGLGSATSRVLVQVADVGTWQPLRPPAQVFSFACIAVQLGRYISKSRRVCLCTSTSMYNTFSLLSCLQVLFTYSTPVSEMRCAHGKPRPQS